jgi:hypothetical protein
MMPAPWDLETHDLDRLSPAAAVDLFRRLLVAEAHTMGLPAGQIEVPQAITVADGGVDAIADGGPAARQGSDLIEFGIKNYYQIKTGDLQIQQLNEVNEILFDDERVRGEDGKWRKTGKKILKAKVKECFDTNSVFHIVLFGWDLPNDRDETIKTNIANALVAAEYAYGNLEIRICRASKIITYLTPFPSLQFDVKGLALDKLRTWTSWVQDEDMQPDFIADPVRTQFRDQITQNLLDTTEKARHIRITGDAGIGKTRLALETTRQPELAALTLYTTDPEDLDGNTLFQSLLQADNRSEIVLVVDECNSENARRLWNKLRNKGRRIKLVTIDMYEKLDGEVLEVSMDELDDDHIKRILAGYGIDPDELNRWAELCGGSPRVAHLLGINLRDHPEDDNLLREGDISAVWKRFVAGPDDANSPDVRQRELLLRHLALFKQVGYLREFQEESTWVAAKLTAHDPTLTLGAFQTQVSTLQRRKVLQGTSSINISPKLLQIKLWADWWQHHAGQFDLATFTEGIPETLLDSFFAMFKFAAVSQVARGLVRTLLGPDGHFEHEDRLADERQAAFFLALAEADPASALRCLKRTVGRWSRQQRLDATGSRRSLVRALEMIAMWNDLFRDAAELLIDLGEAENEAWTNNASGVFASLFSLGYGKLAATEASPLERFPVIETALASDVVERRTLGLKGLEAALHLDVVRTVGAEYQGVRPIPNLWMPETRAELIQAYVRAWTLLETAIDTLEGAEQVSAIGIAIRQGQRMLYYAPLDEAVLPTLERLSHEATQDTWRGLVAMVDAVLYHRKQLSEPTATRLETLREALQGTDFSARLRRWVAVPNFPHRLPQEPDGTNPVEQELQRLAQESLEDPSRLEPELSWLHTAEAQNGAPFGLVLGTRDLEFHLFSMLRNTLLERGKEGNPFFFAGYLGVMQSRQPERWAHEMIAILDDPGLQRYAIELAWRTGITDAFVLRLIDTARRGAIPTSGFELLTYGSSLEHLSQDTAAALITFLLDCGEGSVFTALSLLHAYAVYPQRSERRLPKELTHRVLLVALDSIQSSNWTMDDFRWKSVGHAFLQQYPDATLELAEVMLAHLGKENTLLGRFHAQSLEVLNDIARSTPDAVWEIANRFLPARTTNGYHVAQWLRGYRAAAGVGMPNIIGLITPNLLWTWVEGNLEERAWYLATLVPATLGPAGGTSLARELLVRYGDRDDVRRNLIANFQTEGWMGNMSDHYAKKRANLLGILEHETNRNVQLWLEDFSDSLQKSLEWSQGVEERR